MLRKSASWTGAEAPKLAGTLQQGPSYAETILERLPVGIALISREQKIVYANGVVIASVPDLESKVSEYRDQCQSVFRTGGSAVCGECASDAYQICFHPFDADHVLLFLTASSSSKGIRPDDRVMSALERVSGQVAHRFNNLLTVILSYTDLISTQYKSVDPLRCDLEHIADAARQMSSVTEDLLAFSRGNPTTPGSVKIDKVVAGMANMFETIAGSTPVNIRAESGGASVSLAVKELETVLLNLVRNAREAMRPNAPAITIATSKVMPGTIEYEALIPQLGLATRTYVCVTVADSGVGLPPTRQSRIFEPFFTTKPGANGLGLSVAYGIVKRAGGTLVIDSNVTSGTTARVVLPEVPL
jgi:signal transduction histidine kinase